MTVFYRQYRPQKFSDLIGQEIVVKTLLSQLESGKIGHGYLFFGPKGTGKTSAARIFAKAVNCQSYVRNPKYGEPCNKCLNCQAITNGSHLDLIEIDAASNRGIDEIRDLREKIKLSPISSRFKVYIIDEAHMLTTEAFNALLKTLEEPPRHAIFILCTTEYAKVPPTIISRLQKFNFSKAKREDLEKVIAQIAKSENIKIEEEAIGEIARSADGSYRDAVSTLDQLSGSKRLIKFEDVIRIARVSGENQIYEFADYLARGDIKQAVILIENLVSSQADISNFTKQIILFLEQLLFIKLKIETNLTMEHSQEQIEKMREQANNFTEDDLQKLMRQLLIAESEIKLYPLAQIPLVLAVCKYLPQVRDRKLEDKSRKTSISNQRLEVKSKGLEFRVESLEVRKKGQEDLPISKNSNNKSEQSINVSNLKTKVADKVGQGKKTKGSVKVFEKNWDKFLKNVRMVNAHVEALLRSTRPVDFDGNNLTLEVFYRFHKEKLEEPKIIRILDNVMEKVIERQVKMRFTLASHDSRIPRAVSKSDVVEIGKEDLEKVAREIFSK